MLGSDGVLSSNSALTGCAIVTKFCSLCKKEFDIAFFPHIYNFFDRNLAPSNTFFRYEDTRGILPNFTLLGNALEHFSIFQSGLNDGETELLCKVFFRKVRSLARTWLSRSFLYPSASFIMLERNDDSAEGLASSVPMAGASGSKRAIVSTW